MLEKHLDAHGIPVPQLHGIAKGRQGAPSSLVEGRAKDWGMNCFAGKSRNEKKLVEPATCHASGPRGPAMGPSPPAQTCVQPPTRPAQSRVLPDLSSAELCARAVAGPAWSCVLPIQVRPVPPIRPTGQFGAACHPARSLCPGENPKPYCLRRKTVKINPKTKLSQISMQIGKSSSMVFS